MAYDNISIGTILSELDLQKRNVKIYNQTLVGVPTGNTAADGSPEMIISAISDGSGTLNQSNGKIGKLYRATISGTTIARKALTIEIPAGRYIQVSRYSAKLAEDALNNGTATLNVIFGGTRTGGTLVTAYNYNSLSPANAPFDIYEDAAITTPDNTLTLDGYAYSSTNQASDNATYSVPDAMLIFGDANNPTLITLEIAATTTVYFLAVRVSFSEIDENGVIV